MTWPLSIFLCVAVVAVAILTFCVIVYFKEYAREERMLKDLKAKQKNLDLSTLPIYVMGAPPPKKETSKSKTATTSVPVKNKKDVN